MSNTYNSNLVVKKQYQRGFYNGKPNEVSGRIFLPSGTVLAANDLLLGVPVGENQIIKEVTVLIVGDTDIAAGSTGYFQILDEDGNVVQVQRKGPFGASGTIFASPVTSAAAYHAAAQLDGYTRTPLVTPAKTAGPVNVGVKVTTGATVGANTEIFIGVVFDGEFDTTVSVPYNTDNDYLISAVQGTEQH